MRRQHLARPGVLRAERLEHRDQAVVALALELAERAAGRLRVGLGRDPVDQLAVSSGTSVSFVHGHSSAGPKCSRKPRMPASPPAMR